MRRTTTLLTAFLLAGVPGLAHAQQQHFTAAPVPAAVKPPVLPAQGAGGHGAAFQATNSGPTNATPFSASPSSNLVGSNRIGQNVRTASPPTTPDLQK